MPPPLTELATQIEDLRADMEFVRLASQLRPRLGSILRWEAQGEETELAKRFISANSGTPESVYGPLLIRLLACLESYVRKMIAHAVIRKSKGAKSYDDIAETLGNRNLVLTGRVLATLDSPREYIKFNIEEMVDNLASCRRGASPFKLNAPAFCAQLASVNPSVIEKALENIDLTNWWDKIGANSSIASLLETKGSRATGARAKERLKELSRWRNHLAHGGEGQLVISESQLGEAIELVAAFGTALDSILHQL
jgi:hypothetical protein